MKKVIQGLRVFGDLRHSIFENVVAESCSSNDDTVSMLSPVKMIRQTTYPGPDAGPGSDMLLVRPLAALDSAINRLQEEREKDYRQTRGLQDRLDLLAAALSYNELTAISGFRAFDQDHDGRVSIEDLRRSMCDLEITMQSGELEMLFNHIDADHDGFNSETEWSRVMEADPSLGLAYQHPGVRRMPSKYACDKDAYKVRTCIPATAAVQTLSTEYSAELEQLRRDVRGMGEAKEAYEAQENRLHHELIRQKAELDGAIITLQADNEELKLKLKQNCGTIIKLQAENEELKLKLSKERDAAGVCAQLCSTAPSSRSAAQFASDEQQLNVLKTSELEKAALKEVHARQMCEMQAEVIELRVRVDAREEEVTRLTDVLAKQIGATQAIARDARLYALEHEHKLVANQKLDNARVQIQSLAAQVEELHSIEAL